MVAEKILISRAQQGNEWAFRLLYERYFKLLFGFICQKTHTIQDAEDITSEVWLAVVVGLSEFSHQSSFKNWLFGIARHKLMDYYRQQYRQPLQSLTPEIEKTLAAPIKKKVVDQIDPQLRLQLSSILKQLSPKDQKLLTLRILQNLSVKETAAKLRMTPGAVKTAFHRAIKRARTLID